MSLGVWNNLDEMGLYLGLERLEAETDEEFYNRIRLFGRWRYKTDYLTQVHSIPLQLGLETKSLVKIRSTEEYDCSVDWEYFTLSNNQESLRVFINNSEATLGKILDAIDSSDTFTYSLYDVASRDLPCKFLVRNSNIKLYKDYVAEANTKLKFENIIPQTIISEDKLMFVRQKSSLTDLKNVGDYFIDNAKGYISLFYPGFSGSYVMYKYRDDSFYIEGTELNLMPAKLLVKYGLTDETIDFIPAMLSGKVWG